MSYGFIVRGSKEVIDRILELTQCQIVNIISTSNYNGDNWTECEMHFTKEDLVLIKLAIPGIALELPLEMIDE